MIKLKYIAICCSLLFCFESYGKEIPKPDEGGFVSTLNSYGWSSIYPDPISVEFLYFIKNSTQPALDIGATYGYIAKLALENGSSIIINDIEKKHLELAFDYIPKHLHKNLQMKVGKFPDDLNFPPNSLKAVLARRVLHFLSGRELEIGAKKLHDWLVPGGKVFVLASTPYRKHLSQFLVEYEKKKLEVKYPGEVQDIRKIENSEDYSNLPLFFHYLDADILSRVFEQAGFKIEKAIYINIEEMPEFMKLDGRENVGLVAKKI
jgi:SAM-dependent methyltransferase